MLTILKIVGFIFVVLAILPVMFFAAEKIRGKYRINDLLFLIALLIVEWVVGGIYVYKVF